jgi:hypothetical protein
MAREGKITKMAVLKSVMPLGYYANPTPQEDTTLRDLQWVLGEKAAEIGYKPGEQFEYEITIKRK